MALPKNLTCRIILVQSPHRRQVDTSGLTGVKTEKQANWSGRFTGFGRSIDDETDMKKPPLYRGFLLLGYAGLSERREVVRGGLVPTAPEKLTRPDAPGQVVLVVIDVASASRVFGPFLVTSNPGFPGFEQ